MGSPTCEAPIARGLAGGSYTSGNIIYQFHQSKNYEIAFTFKTLFNPSWDPSIPSNAKGSSMKLLDVIS